MNTRPRVTLGAARERVLNRRAATRRITCCEDDRLPQLLGGKVFHVEHGNVV